jgi:hypothetical protein
MAASGSGAWTKKYSREPGPPPSRSVRAMIRQAFFIPPICAPDRPFSSAELCHNQTDPLPGTGIHHTGTSILVYARHLGRLNMRYRNAEIPIKMTRNPTQSGIIAPKCPLFNPMVFLIRFSTINNSNPQVLNRQRPRKRSRRRPANFQWTGARNRFTPLPVWMLIRPPANHVRETHHADCEMVMA